MVWRHPRTKVLRRLIVPEKTSPSFFLIKNPRLANLLKEKKVKQRKYQNRKTVEGEEKQLGSN